MYVVNKILGKLIVVWEFFYADGPNESWNKMPGYKKNDIDQVFAIEFFYEWLLTTG